MSRPGDDLRTSADVLFRAQRPSVGQYPEQFPDEVVFGEFAARPGETTTVSLRVQEGRKPLLSIRDWIVRPDGSGRVPMRSGITINAESVPRFAHLLAEAMEMLAKQQLEHNRAGRRGMR